MSAAGAALRRARARARGCAIVLAYHRVADLERDPQLLAVTPARFEEHVRAISGAHATMSAGALFETMRAGGRLPRRCVTLTFDDGYEDVLTTAAPVLRRYGVPATAFVVSGAVGSTGEFWWDDVERCTLGATVLPARLSLEAGGQRLDLDLAGDDAGIQGDAGWNVLRSPATERQRAYLAACDFLRDLPPAARDGAVGRLRAQAGVAEEGRASHRALSAEQLRDLAAGGLVEIGAHTTAHARLAGLDEQAQHEQIAGSRAALKELVPGPVTSFAYPHGDPGSFTPITERLVREAGFTGACTTRPGIVLPGYDRYAVPRFHVPDVSGDGLLRQIEEWFDAAR